MGKDNLKTKPTKLSVTKFITDIKDENIKADCKRLVKIFETATKEKAVMWGTSIIGFGEYHYKYLTGKEGDWARTGFSPRKANITIYIMDGLDEYKDLLKDLGKFTTAKSCLYIKRLEDIDPKVLIRIIRASFKNIKKIYP